METPVFTGPTSFCQRLTVVWKLDGVDSCRAPYPKLVRRQIMLAKHVVVTGANGFIGRHLCPDLVQAGRRVTACIREDADSSVLGEQDDNLRVCRVGQDGTSPELYPVFRTADAVIHLAGRAHVMHETIDNPIAEFQRINVGLTEKFAALAMESGVKRFIYLSSIKVNGEATRDKPFLADGCPGFCDTYGQSKWIAEEALRRMTAGTRMEWVVVRPPMVYGPHVRGNFLTLLEQVSRSTPLPIGNIHNLRSLMGVHNLADLLSLLVDHPRAANQCFLASDGEDVSTPELVRAMAVALRRPAHIVRCPEVLLELAGTIFGKRSMIQRLSSSLVLDRYKTNQILGWTAPVTLGCGLRETAEWFLTNNDAR
jgi:nucleoside-diphosphate-sugar epimerase